MKNEFAYSEAEVEGSSPRETLALWIGILGSPGVWALQLQTCYMLVPWACSTGHHWTLHAATVLFLILATIPVFVAWRCRQVSGRGERETTGDGRRRFMAMLGLMVSTFFLLVIAAQGIPSFFIDPCLD